MSDPSDMPPVVSSGAEDSAKSASKPDVVADTSTQFVPAKPKKRDMVLAGVGVTAMAILMRLQGHKPWGVPLGIVLTVMSVLGVLGLLGDSPLDLRGDEKIESPTLDARPWYLREGAWVLLFGALLYFPLAGAYGLWDPWETHYSEVAREILSRDDWITTWWGQEGWFMSKPVLIFWMSALGMGIGTMFGLNIYPDGGPQFQEWCIRLPISALAVAAMYALYRAVASAWGRRAGLLVAMVLGTMPHWFFLAHQAMTDMPFVGPLVIAVSMLMFAITAGDRMARSRVVTLLGRPMRWSLWHHAVGLPLLLIVPQVVYLFTRTMVVRCPEDSRMAQCQDMLRQNHIGSLQFPVETYFYGSAINSSPDGLAASVPGSPAWERLANVIPFFPSAVQAVIWTVLTGLAMWFLRNERRASHLFFALFYVWCAVATMGKGPAGLVIPVAIAGFYLVTSGRWSLLRRARVLTGACLYLAVGMPWYIAILGRLGNEFFDRFVVHDIINRTLAGVHGDTGSLRYFIWQLGYAMFPWTGLVPVALLGWRQIVPKTATPEQRAIATMGACWFILAFSLFSAMITKFHHYIFPAVPGAAVMVGLLLDRMLGKTSLSRVANPAAPIALTFVGVASMVVGIANFFGSARGLIPRDAPGMLPAGSRSLAVVLTAFGIAAIGWAWSALRKADIEPVETALKTDEAAVAEDGTPSPSSVSETPSKQVVSNEAYNPVSLGAMAIAGAAVIAFVARDLGYSGTSHPPGYQRLLQLFTYQYERQWPTASLDYHAVLIGFGAVAVVISAAIAVHSMRAHAVRAMIALAAVFAVWALDFYIVDVSRHWSQRTIFERYYSMRRERPGVSQDTPYRFEPMGAYQMNWKGENFYTGGRAAMLDCGDLPFCNSHPQNHIPAWLRARAGERVWVITERSHSGGALSHLRANGGTAEEVTNDWDQNKFVLIVGTVGSNTSQQH
jgi:4-amino-4-deoxy-L-arabinose transferase-like glycosyltransferase